MHMRLRVMLVATFTCLAGFAGGATAQSTWNLGGSTCNPSGGTATCAVSGVTATMSALGNAGGTFTTGTLTAYDPNGFGAKTGANETTTDSQHAFDSATTGCGGAACGGTAEALLIGFGSAKVNLTSLAIGFYSVDADVSVLRWDGGGNPVMTGVGVGGLAAAGWTLVSSKDVAAGGVPIDNENTALVGTGDGALRYDVKTGTGYDSASNNKVSSWWMISTYYGATTASLDAGNDRFKLLNFVASVCTTVTGGNGGNGGTCTSKVSEPGSLALVALSLMGGLAFRSRRGRPGGRAAALTAA